MKCPHCQAHIHFQPKHEFVYLVEGDVMDSIAEGVVGGTCPGCSGLIVLRRRGDYFSQCEPSIASEDLEFEEVLYPRRPAGRQISEEVPKSYRKDFAEAERVLPESPRASAALSRRILQEILHNEYKIKGSSLAEEITQFLNRTGIPPWISDAVDAIRNVGNFAAHPIYHKITDQILPVEPGEAEWLLDVLQALFDFTFTQPARLAENRNRLNAKLAAAGKPQLKG